MINELQRKITTHDMRAGQGPALLYRLGINLKPVNGLTCTCGHATVAPVTSQSQPSHAMPSAPASDIRT